MTDSTPPTNAKWQPDGSPIAIEYPLEAIARIRDQVIIGFHRLAKRGIEVGGILYGHREARRVTILDSRPIRCEYKTGPSFVLSDADREALAQQLANPPSDLAAPNLTAVGIYISHTKDDIRATERDLAVYEEFFGDPWQVLLILRPGRQGAVRAGFFVREPFGNFRADQSYEEFELDPPESAAEAAALIAAARLSESAAVAQAVAPTRPRALAAAAGAGSYGGSFYGNGGAQMVPYQQTAPAPLQAQMDPALVQANEALIARLMQQRAQQAEAAAPHVGRQWAWIGVWLAGIAFICVATYWLLSLRTPAPLLLRVSEQNGDLHIEWDRSSSTIRRASTASLEIRDGQRTRDISLNSEQLAAGHYMFAAAGLSDVAIRLSVDGLLIPRVEESANFIPAAQPANKAVNEIKEQRDKLASENRRLRLEMKKLEERAKAAEERAAQTAAQRQRRNKAAAAK